MKKIGFSSSCAALIAVASVIALCQGSLEAEESRGCNVGILRGGYGTATSGWINNSINPNDITIGTFVPFAEAVRFVYDGNGNISGFSTANFGGSSFPVTFSGTYIVKSDCSGSMTINAGANGIIHRDLVIVDGGREVDFVSTDPGLVIAGSMRRQRTRTETE